MMISLKHIESLPAAGNNVATVRPPLSMTYIYNRQNRKWVNLSIICLFSAAKCKSQLGENKAFKSPQVHDLNASFGLFLSLPMPSMMDLTLWYQNFTEAQLCCLFQLFHRVWCSSRPFWSAFTFSLFSKQVMYFVRMCARGRLCGVITSTKSSDLCSDLGVNYSVKLPALISQFSSTNCL